MIELGGALTQPFAKLLLKSYLGDLAADIGGNLFDLALERFKEARQAMTAQQKAEEVAKAVVRDLEDFFLGERVDPEALQVAAYALGSTIETQVDAAFLVHQKLDADAIEKELLTAKPPEKIFKTAEPEHALYRQLISAAASRLRAVAPEMPDFHLERDARILEQLEDIAEKAPEVLKILDRIEPKIDEIHDRPNKIAKGFEEDYLKAARTELDYVEIFGIDELDAKSKRAQLSVAYLSLTAQLNTEDGGRRIDYTTVLALMPELGEGNRLLIEGSAGSGKTTLVRWATIEAAKWRLGQSDDEDILKSAKDLDYWLNYLSPYDPAPEFAELADVAKRSGLAEAAVEPFKPADEQPHGITETERDMFRAAMKLGEHPKMDALRETAWRQRLPILVPLRDVKHGLEFKELTSIALRMAGSPPEGWLTEAFADDGQKILLIFDGVDEVPAGARRDKILGKIETYARRYAKAQILVTTRPGAVHPDRLSDFFRIELNELDASQQRAFMAHWHDALTINARRQPGDKTIAALLRALRRELEAQPALSRLATNPLLCSAICALHWSRRRKVVEDGWRHQETESNFAGSVLPDRLWNLCEGLLHMLVDLRDVDRGIEREMSYALKREVLAFLAYQMVAGDVFSSMPISKALPSIKSVLEKQRYNTNPPDWVLSHLLERSGVLRGSGEDGIEFVHNTLKTFLAAKFYLGLGVPEELVRRIVAATGEELASGLDEIAVFAAASPDHPTYAERMVEMLLKGQEPGVRGMINRLVQSEDDTRKLQILAVRCESIARGLPSALGKTANSLAGKLFPPRSQSEAQQLAALGDEALPYLAIDPDRPNQPHAYIARTLRLIGTDRAREAMKAYLKTESLDLVEELADDISPFEFDVIRLAVRSSGKWSAISPGIKKACHDSSELGDLSDVESLYLSGTQVAELDALKGLTGLQSLDLSSTQVSDLDALKGLAGLGYLELSGTQVADVDPLKGLARLGNLNLSGTQVADLGALKGLARLGNLNLSGTQVADLGALKGSAGLQQIDLSLTQVSDLDAFKGLAGLWYLDLKGTQVSDLDALKSLTGLGYLNLRGTQVSDLDALKNLAGLWYLDLRDTQVSDLDALKSLTGLQYLYLSGTNVNREDVAKLKESLPNCAILQGGSGGIWNKLRDLTR